MQQVLLDLDLFLCCVFHLLEKIEEHHGSEIAAVSALPPALI